jgi:hypothetical protein
MGESANTFESIQPDLKDTYNSKPTPRFAKLKQKLKKKKTK